MSGWTLSSATTPPVRVDLAGITPARLAGLSAAEIERLPVGCGKVERPLAEFFRVAPRADDDLVFAADLARCDRVGWKLDGGRIVVAGDCGHYAGGVMTAGEMHVEGHALDLAGCEMAGGLLHIGGGIGDFGAGTLAGSLDGMRGGTLVVGGNVGARFGDRMRRGTAVIFGDAGDFLASRMVAGTIALAGRSGAHAGYGMRRGSLVFAGPPPQAIAPTFVAGRGSVAVAWQLLARDLARHGGAFAGLPGRSCERWLGDLAVAGKGELIIPR